MPSPSSAASSPATDVAIVQRMRPNRPGSFSWESTTSTRWRCCPSRPPQRVPPFARAADGSRDRDERQEQLRFLTTMLASVRWLLDRFEQAAAQLAAELGSTRCGGCIRHRKAVGVPGQFGVPLNCPAGFGRCPRCNRRSSALETPSPTASRPPSSCGTPRARNRPCVCRRLRPRCGHDNCLAVVTASRAARSVLGDITGQSCLISRHVSLLVQGGPCCA